MGRIALVFPGQGSQAVGMGAGLIASSDEARSLYEAADELLGRPLTRMSLEGPADELARTQNSQPALYVNSAAAMAVLKAAGVNGDAVCGHSLGEYSALAACGAVGFEEGLRLVERRGLLMAEAAAERPGSMAAILGLEDGQVEEICASAGDVWPVNYNSPGQLVISGRAEAVGRAVAAAEAAGAKKAVMLAVSGAFHSPLMEDAAARMEAVLGEAAFAEPQPPFFSSISCSYEDAAQMAGVLVRQITSPVRWRQSIEQLIADGFDRFIEVGSGKVLCGLIRRIDRNVTAAPFSGPGDLEKVLALV